MLAEYTRLDLPLDNLLGFGATDIAETALAAGALAILAGRVWAGKRIVEFAGTTRRCIWLLIGLAFLLRVLLLPQHPVPTPSGADDFSYLLLGDTLAHGRLANPVHPLHQFFEAVFVLQTPSYSSIFPLGQGLVLAAGKILFGEPWVGVLLSESVLCGLCYWMLRGFVKPVWALAGGLLAVAEFGPLCAWMNLYWGGAVAGIAGCLVFGSLPRWCETRHWRWALLGGAGLGLHLLARPFETFFLAASAVAFLIWEQREKVAAWPWRQAAFASAGVLAAVLLTALQNRAVTGRWTEMPYQASRYQYGLPATLTFQANAVPHNPLTLEQKAQYEAQAAMHGDGDNAARFWQRMGYRLRFVRFFLYPPLYLALFACLWRLREKRVIWVLGTVLLFAVGTNFYARFYAHYVAALTCLFLLLAVLGLEQFWRWEWRGVNWGRAAAGIVLALSLARFVFWYGLHLFGSAQANLALTPYESWDYLDSSDAAGRAPVERILAARPGKQLVFVRYSPAHRFPEWIYNDAAIDQSRVVRAADLGTNENQKLLHYYPDRTAWLLEPDVWPPRLTLYSEVTSPPAEQEKPPAQVPGKEQKKGAKVSDWLEPVK